MKRIKIANWKKYAFEFLSIFIAVVAAFSLNNWNENRKAKMSGSKILMEISNGLEKDVEDIRHNEYGHQQGINACEFFRDVVAGKKVNTDSLMVYYYALTRDYVSIQNTAGYETLKSRGLELIKNDSLRLQIISLYEYNYNILKKLEEEYYEMQFQENYFFEINKSLAPYFLFDDKKEVVGIDLPLKFSGTEENTLLLYLWKIQRNRVYILDYYSEVENKISKIQFQINEELEG
ncbi:MAG: hypothetical protein JXR07_14155 [Reichenbachiella sp.]